MQAAGTELGHHLGVVLRDAAERGAFVGGEKVELGGVADGGEQAEIVAEGGGESVGEFAAEEELLLTRKTAGAGGAPPAAVGGGGGFNRAAVLCADLALWTGCAA